MTEIIKYVADDGTEFDDEWDCRRYEWEQGTKDAEYVLLSQNYKVLPKDDPNSYDDAFYIFVPTEESIHKLLDNWDGEMISTYSPNVLCYTQRNELGLYAWDEDKEEWYHLGNRLDELAKQAKLAMQAINGGV